MPESIFGALYGPQDIEDAVVAVYRSWFNEYITQIEFQRGFQHGTIPRPPSTDSIHGGVDFETWSEDDAPELIVIVKDKSGEPDRHGNGIITGNYEVHVGSVWIGKGNTLWPYAEDEARAVVSYLGTASQLLIQKGNAISLPIEEIVMSTQPTVTFPDMENKTLAQVTTVFTMSLLGIVNELMGPTGVTPETSPGYPGGPEREWPDLPTVQSEHLTVTGERL